MIKIIKYSIFIVALLLAFIVGFTYSKFKVDDDQNAIAVNIPEKELDAKEESSSINSKETISKENTVLQITEPSESLDQEDIDKMIKEKENRLNRQNNEEAIQEELREQIQEEIQEESLEPEQVLKPEDIQEIPSEEIMIEEPSSIIEKEPLLENEIENGI